MSFCRWISDDFQCDVYCYEDVRGGFTTMVAERRHIFTEPLPPPIEWNEENHTAFWAWRATVNQMLDRAELQDIGLPHDGEIFNDSDAGAAARRLEELREAGYNVPQYAIDALRRRGRQFGS